MTTLDCTARTAPAIMLLEAMVRESKSSSNLEKMFKLSENPEERRFVDVCLTINGVEVDFVKTAQEMWDRLRRAHEEDVLEKAKELISLTGFSKLEDAIQVAQSKLADELFALTKDMNK